MARSPSVRFYSGQGLRYGASMRRAHALGTTAHRRRQRTVKGVGVELTGLRQVC